MPALFRPRDACPCRRPVSLGIALVGWLAAAGCTRWPGQDRPGRTSPPAVTPRQTIARLIEARTAGDYDRMKLLIVPGRVADVTSTLVAADDFLAANRQLCDLVRREVGPGLAESIDQSFRAYYLDIFSRHVELLDETSSGDSATVSFTVDGRLPVRRAELRLVEGAWRYDPGPGDYRQLAEALQRMARGLRLTADEIRSGRLPPQALRDDPARLAEEVRIRLLPGMKLLPEPTTTASAGPGK